MKVDSTKAGAEPKRAKLEEGWRVKWGLHKDFPLFPHQSGRWAKKVRGKLHYFGPIDGDAKGVKALGLWVEQKDDLLAGRTPRSKSGGLEIRDLCNHFLTAKQRLLVSGDITPRTFDDYRDTTDRITAELGKNRLVDDLSPLDFDKLRAELSKTLGPVALSNAIQRIKSVFNYGVAAELFDKPVRFGPNFKRPSRKLIRKAKADKGPRMFEATALRTIIDQADVQMKAMILLGINGGLGNSDIANLPLKALDLERGWLDFPRPKTGIQRRIPLWPETVKALEDAIEKRPIPKSEDDEGLVFITKYGHNWAKLGKFDADKDLAPAKDGEKRRKRISSNNSLSKEFRKLADDVGVSRTFYDLRHTFRTVGDETLEQVAVDSIMGHADESMAARYRELIRDERLLKVTNYVRSWLFPQDQAAKPRKQGPLPAKAANQNVAPKSQTKRQAVRAEDEWPQLRIVG